MRIPIRIQLGSLILLSSIIGLAVISVAVWITVHNFILVLRAQRLASTATLKAGQLDSYLDIMQTSAAFVTTRVLVQQALQRYNLFGNNTDQNWEEPQADVRAAINGEESVGQQLLFQARVYGKNDAGPAGPFALLNATAASIDGQVKLPYLDANGSPVYLGDEDLGYPPVLYPNLTYFSEDVNSDTVIARALYNGRVITNTSKLLLGPWQVNDTMALVSLTMTISNNTNVEDVLGFLTVIMDARLISSVMDMRQGLGSTGGTLLLGPANSTNIFPHQVITQARNREEPEFEVHYILPLNDTYRSRHPNHVQGTANAPFNATEFPTIYRALAHANANMSDNAGANVKAVNEDSDKVSVGYAMSQSPLVNWLVLVEQSRKEVWEPINELRNVILACLFATAALMAVIAYPLAHFAALPIVRLKQATAKSVEPPGTASSSEADSIGHFHDGPADDAEHGAATAIARKEGFARPVRKWKRKREESAHARREDRRKRAFRIPAKVKERKYCIKDELSDLTSTFNEMSDELMLQYSKLEERVQQRTAELELSKKAAEAANESKTLFIANISHELKTPLNGILGMCAVCMQEDDPLRLKRSLGIIYKSGDLLLNLLTDLLTFSKNQVGQSLSLDEKEFRLRDISTQTLAIFEKQAMEGKIDLRVCYEGVHNSATDKGSPERQEKGPADTGRLRDMFLWGDVHRILQVVINLVSNSLKFTPPGGAVTLTIRCLPDLPDVGSRKSSINSRHSVRHASRHRSSDISVPRSRLSTANAINTIDKPHALAYVSTHERHPSPLPGKFIQFEFEVTDTGPGIPENLLGRIFEPFVQGDLGLSKKYGGTGLGLSICSQLAQLMRGSMSVRSTIGEGSVFTMKIPLRHVKSRADSTASSTVDRMEGGSQRSSLDGIDSQPAHGPIEYDESAMTPIEPRPPPNPAVTGKLSNESQPRLVGLSQPFFTSSQPLESPGSQPAAMQQIASQAGRGGRIRVLVAEDNKVNQEVVLRMLKLEDIYDVTVAKDGQEALDLVKESMQGEDSQPFNLIFMDVQMPNVDGIQSTRLIREIGYQAPIVALTAFAEESNIKDCLDSGMNQFLSKPIRRPQLKKVLSEYCAPIPEENEDSIEISDRRASKAQTTGSTDQAQALVSTTAKSPPGDMASSSAARSFDAEDERPVSPKDVT